jgi:hypothetical protein
MNEHRPPPPPVRVDSISGLEAKPLPRLPDDELNKKKKTNSKGKIRHELSLHENIFFPLDWTKKDPSKLTISRPTNFNHPIHVTYNSSTGEFDGMPEIWSSLLQHSKITKQEQKQNPQAVIHALDFYQHAAQKRESKFMYSSYKSNLLYSDKIKFVKLIFRFNTTDIRRFGR